MKSIWRKLSESRRDKPMKGLYHVIVQNRRVRFEFDIRRNLTLIRGDSATGKTTLLSMIESFNRFGSDSGIEVSCKRPCVVLGNMNWEILLDNIHESIVFIDEDGTFVKSEAFAKTIRATDNYYVIVTRESLPMLPYSVEEIYGIHNSGKYSDLRKTYNSFYRLYSLDGQKRQTPASTVIAEDSNAGFEFCQQIVREEVRCVSAGGKTNVRRILGEMREAPILVIADGAAFGSEIGEIYQYMQTHPNIYLYLPESFEWVILSSGLIDGKRIQEILQNPENYVDSRRFFSWEQFFTSLLVQETAGTYLRYSKQRLNENYLNPKCKGDIVKVIEVIRDIV